MILPKTRKPWWINLAINSLLAILSITIFFGSLEIFARYRCWGWRLKETGFYSRGKTYTPKKEMPSLRIVCIGGSTTGWGGNNEPDEAYPFYLEQILNEKFDGPFVEVLNSGISATATEYHRDFIKERINDQELDIIILHSVYNYLGPFFPSHNPKIDKFIIDGAKIKTVYRWDKMSVPEKINIFLIEHSYFYDRFHDRIILLKKKARDKYYERLSQIRTSVQDEKWVHEVNSQADRDEILALYIERYRGIIREIISTAASRDIDVILVVPPYPLFLKNDPDIIPDVYFKAVFEKARQCLLEVGEENNLLIIDAGKEFPRDKALFNDVIHLSSDGNYLLAEIIASKLTPFLKRHEGVLETLEQGRVAETPVEEMKPGVRPKL